MIAKNLTKEMAYKLRKIRQTLNVSNSVMAAKLRIGRSTYNRNEEGQTLPGTLTLFRLGNYFNISLDWFVFNRGSMFYQEQAVENEKDTNKEEPERLVPEGFLALQNLGDDIKELLESMERIPLLRYEVLVLFHKFKKENKGMMEEVMSDKKE
ncbi:MAG: helix-turn-helix domain-containing protein [Candidatus Aminicenantes bacterium]|nr:helix-turn-helix domain-containing protein [Candidatus Aminicenantes bacterium]NIM82919.1 helix-turn-helix domain-containing protein [Candidatus Aminicenantes bacterium]NIN22295.1 helix-turn-helix domain-containing protein [Candidatus Aminicenantes bacterium]NIN46063.1 helix-turn-helix domain-containing protein [Candidatus Aminicenantes bacterium]NIN88899.1 helix-turn-helix domain-containing protein [Candidatus Aminicenantes bacterium]